MTTIRLARPTDAKAVLTLAQGLATTFVVDPQAFDLTFLELLADPSSDLAVAVHDPSIRDNWAGEVEPKERSIVVPEMVVSQK
jgi:hypothetical protein